jgi:hypothetical protein
MIYFTVSPFIALFFINMLKHEGCTNILRETAKSAMGFNILQLEDDEDD